MAFQADGESRVAVVDEHGLSRMGICAALRPWPSLRVTGVGASASDARALLAEGADVMVLDINVASGSGLALLEELRARRPAVRFVVVSALDELVFAEHVVRLGASAFLSKRGPPERVVDAVQRALRGEITLSARIMQRLASRLAVDSVADPRTRLTRREVEVLHLMGRGRTTQQIAHALHLSPKTIETHRAKARRKLGVDSTFDLLRFALQMHGQ